MIEKNILEIKNKLQGKAELLVVSKFRNKAEILKVYNLGQRKFAENRVQNLLERVKELPNDIEWHLIGHLQSNKVRDITSFIHTIQSVDSIKLLNEIEKQAQKFNRQISVYLQIFIAQEDTKFGLSYLEAENCINYYVNNEFKYVKITGFMAMASNTGNKIQISNEFKNLNAWIENTQKKFPQLNLKNKSFGMSSDFEIAIENGSNLVRIGSLVFNLCE